MSKDHHDNDMLDFDDVEDLFDEETDENRDADDSGFPVREAVGKTSFSLSPAAELFLRGKMVEKLLEREGETGQSVSGIRNRAESLADNRKYAMAARVCEKGLEHFPKDASLLGDAVRYYALAHSMDEAARCYAQLREIPMQRWDWSAYSHAMEYLTLLDPEANEAECRELLRRYRRHLPHEERSYLAESELEEALGNEEAAIRALREATQALTNACGCALLLAVKLLFRGSFEEARAAADYGIAACAVPGQSRKYLLRLAHIRAYAADYLLRMRRLRGDEVTPEEVHRLEADYQRILDQKTIDLVPNVVEIRQRKAFLKELLPQERLQEKENAYDLAQNDDEHAVP